MDTTINVNEIYVDLKTNFITPLRDLIKRGLDIFAAVIGILIFWPFVVLVAILIKIEDPGPVFYRGRRVGMGGKIFKILKFRTMYERPESYLGSPITASDDDRITPIGRWLRDTKLNELPQLWNVLNGDMSLVGPRPEDPEIFLTLPENYREKIVSVRPGITSPASIMYHDEEKILTSKNLMDDYAELILPNKMRMDLLYVRYHNLINDFDTLFWTFAILIFRIGKQNIREGWLYNGPIARFVRHYLNWFMIDFITASAGIVSVGLGWRLFEPLDLGISNALILGIILAFSFSISNSILEVNLISWQQAGAGDSIKLIISCLLVGIFYIILNVYVGIIPQLTTLFIAIACLVVLGAFVGVRYRSRLIMGIATRWINSRQSSIGVYERALIIGAGNAGKFTTWTLKHPDFRHFYKVIGYVDDAPGKQGMRFDGIKVLGTTADIPNLVTKHNIGLLFYSIRDANETGKARILSICRQVELPIVSVPDVIDNMLHLFAQSMKSID